jgi:hypothetical protein
VFDILLLASFKCLFAFILVSELENVTVRLSVDRADHVLNSNSNSDQGGVSAEIESLSDTDQLVNRLDHVDDSQLNRNLKLIQRLLHTLLAALNLASLSYVAVKFALILKQILDSKKNTLATFEFNSELTTAMNYFFFSILVTQFAFEVIETSLSVVSWPFFNRLGKDVMVKYYISSTLNAANESGGASTANNEVNLIRLVSLSYPERYFIFVGFIMLIISSFTSIAVPYFFGLVVDAALKYADLVEMNKYIIYMFLVFVVGSVAGGLRSYLFELAGQRVVARLRNSVFSSIIRLDIKFFDTNRTGELTR